MRAIDADKLKIIISGCSWELNRVQICKLIDEQLTIDPKPPWISCKERMPDKDGDYIVSGKWEDGEKSVGECDYRTEDGYFSASWRFTVLAWMKKPEPYQEVVL